DLAEMDLPVDPSLALSIARRESEFNEGIASPVGALGLMQVMPATAREVAGNLGLPYARGRLTTDWRYNAALGGAYLAFLEEEFGPSPVMIAAGYNAGPGRPFSWMDERGDPRLLEMDVVDWIEHIPFRETRNYVMRVTESIPIYEARLTGQTGPVRFTELLIGKKPLLRPRARPVPTVETAYDVRPIARP
ncbi:MAG: lytic transglycosylase domain-containing protein, partial [Pseudomonadota bacterium]